MKHLRDLGRRKVRTTLTILGITIGIWALVVFGSMANKINALVEGGSEYYTGKVTLSDASAGSLGGFASTPMSITTVDDVRAIDGVDVAFPVVMMLMDDSASAVTIVFESDGDLGALPGVDGRAAVATLHPADRGPLRLRERWALHHGIRRG